MVVFNIAVVTRLDSGLGVASPAPHGLEAVIAGDGVDGRLETRSWGLGVYTCLHITGSLRRPVHNGIRMVG